MLGYSNTRDALSKHVDNEDKTTVAIFDTGSNDKSTAPIQGPAYETRVTLINESGLYTLTATQVAKTFYFTIIVVPLRPFL